MKPSAPQTVRDGPALALLSIIVIGWWAYPWLIPGHLARDGDSFYLFYPAVEFARAELLAGRIPLWDPRKFLGAPFAANLLIPVFYPPMTAALLLPQPFGLYLCMVGHFALGGALAYLAARRGFGVGRAGAMMAGLTFALCGSLAAHRAHPNQIMAAVWLPAVLLGGMKLVEAERPRRAATWLGLALGLQGLAGQPQFIIYSGVVLGVVVVGGAFRALFVGQIRQVGLVGRPFRGLLLAAVIGAGLSAVAILPARELSQHSVRRILDPSVATSFSLPWRALIGLLWPPYAPADATVGGWSFTEFAIFLGWVAPLLAVVGCLARRRAAGAWMLAALAVIGLLLALGDATPLHGWAMAVFPPLGLFRAPARAFILTALAVSVLAGFGVDAALHKRRARGIVAALFALQIAGFGYFRFVVAPDRYASRDVASLPGVETELPESESDRGRAFSMIGEIDYTNPSEAATVARVRTLHADLNAVKGVSIASGYEGGMLPMADFSRFFRHFGRSIYAPDPDPALLGLMGVRFLISDKPQEGSGLALRSRRVWPGVGRFIYDPAGEIAVYENRAWRGEVFERADWPGVDFDLLGASFDGRWSEERVPIVAPGAAELSRMAPRVSYRRPRAGVVEVELNDNAGGEILLSETWMPGWRAKIEGGGTVEGRRVAPFLIGFDLTPGARAARLVYRPRSFAVGAWISGVTALALLVFNGVAAYRRRSRASDESDV
jgi:hypothetical protein